MFTYRRSVAFVCLFVGTITSEGLNVGRSNLAIRYVVQKSCPSLKFRVKGQRSRSPGTETKKLLSHPHSFTVYSRACAVARPYAASSNRRYYCVATQRLYRLRRWQNRRMLSSIGQLSHVCNSVSIYCVARGLKAILGPSFL